MIDKKTKIEVFIDESGVGRKTGYSIYCLTQCLSKYKNFLDEEIYKIEKTLNIAPFHWRKQSWRIKKRFLRRILKVLHWECTICIVDNKIHPYQTPEEIIAKSLLGLEIDTLYIDGKKTKKYTHAVKIALKELGLTVGILKLVTASSCGGLRISDAVAGLVRLSLEGKLDAEVVEILKVVDKKITTQVVSGHLPNPPHGR